MENRIPQEHSKNRILHAKKSESMVEAQMYTTRSKRTDMMSLSRSPTKKVKLAEPRRHTISINNGNSENINPVMARPLDQKMSSRERYSSQQLSPERESQVLRQRCPNQLANESNGPQEGRDDRNSKYGGNLSLSKQRSSQTSRGQLRQSYSSSQNNFVTTDAPARRSKQQRINQSRNGPS